MEMTEEQFDAMMKHTLRIEMLNGVVLIYRVSTNEKQRLIGQLRRRSDGWEQGDPLVFLFFQTSLLRNVIVRVSEIVRVIFCFDPVEEVIDPNAYYDNFKVLEKDTSLVEEATAEGRVALRVVTEEFLPSVIIFHNGIAADDGYDSNPLLYYDLQTGCLDSFNLELDDDNLTVRQFINLMDMDGEANFILTAHITVMEFDEILLHNFEQEQDETEENEAVELSIEDILDDLPQANEPGDTDKNEDPLPF